MLQRSWAASHLASLERSQRRSDALLPCSTAVYISLSYNVKIRQVVVLLVLCATYGSVSLSIPSCDQQLVDEAEA